MVCQCIDILCKRSCRNTDVITHGPLLRAIHATRCHNASLPLHAAGFVEMTDRRLWAFICVPSDPLATRVLNQCEWFGCQCLQLSSLFWAISKSYDFF